MSFRVRTQAFTGPFDLLLTLVSRQRVAIGAISVSEVADQYLEEMGRMGELDLDVASDFLLVASTLLEMKAASLVGDASPSRADDDLDDGDDLDGLTPDEAREVLVARLVAYKQFRGAAAALAARAETESRMLPRTAGPGPEFQELMPDYLEGVTLGSLAALCANLDGRRESLLLDAEHVAPRRVPVALTTASVDRVVRSRGRASFSELLGGAHGPEAVVVTFLAVLELCAHGLVTLEQAEPFGEIEVAHVEGAAPYEIDPAALEATGDE